MKTPPRYIQNNASTFLTCMELIRRGQYSSASMLAKSTRSHRLVRKIQQKIDATYLKRSSKSQSYSLTQGSTPKQMRANY